MRHALLALALALVGCSAPKVSPDAEAAAARALAQAERLSLAQRWVEALRAWGVVVSNDPFSSRAHVERGLCYYKLGAYELEITEYKKALAINPAYPDALRRLGHALLAVDQLADARTVYWRYLSECPKDTRVLFNLAQIEEQMGDAPAAARLLQRYRELVKPSE